ncbi:MAG: NUDIX domain-containing protein [Muribaculaceae bacterium]|nr:NUDIX domain-containing protein [Muribaculaceae bacterium]
MDKDNALELFPVVDEEGTIIGSASRGECHGGSLLLHPVVHLHLFDNEGRLYLQKRPQWKDIQPGKWDTAVGGHVDFGEDVCEALIREVREELGLAVSNPEMLRRYVFESDRERELVNVFKVVTDMMPTPSDELDGGRFWSRTEILDSMGKGVFTPNFESEYLMLFGD